MDKNFLKSSYREKLIEHLFIGEILKLSWMSDQCSIEVSKPEVDSQGYDLIIENNSCLRHVQLKTSAIGARASGQKVHVALGHKHSGCVVWIYFNEDTLQLGPFLFFGNEPGKPLPNIQEFRIAKHTKANAQGTKNERPEIRVIPKGQFTVLNSIEELSGALFGEST